MFFDQLDKHVPDPFFSNKYIFVDKSDGGLPSDYKVIYYDTAKKYRDQFLSGIQHVKEEFCIYISEDYILYENIRSDLIQNYRTVLEENRNLSFVRFMKGGLGDVDFPPYRHYPKLHQMHHSFPYFYTNQAAIWRTRDLEKIHMHGPNLHIANKDWENSFEYQATQTCKELDIRGVFCYHGESKRGQYHYDCDVFPHISTALIKGKWNIHEYQKELLPLLTQYNIEAMLRGVNEC